MISKEIENRRAVEMLCTDMLVPQDYLLRKIDGAVDFKKIYEFVENLYSRDNGRPSVDPVVLFKMVFIQHLFDIRSLRQTVKEIELRQHRTKSHQREPVPSFCDIMCTWISK